MQKDIHALRKNYTRSKLVRADLNSSPFEVFNQWFDSARTYGVQEPNAMTLSTVNELGQPSSRTVLLKETNEKGLIFYTSFESDKARDIKTNPYVSVLFLWLEMERQIRINGVAEKMDDETATAYFQSRPKGSQIGAWASIQSEVLESRETLDEKARKIEEKYKDVEVLPKPPLWGGFLIVPNSFEFWQGRSSRLHDRFRYTLNEKGDWNIDRLSP